MRHPFPALFLVLLLGGLAADAWSAPPHLSDATREIFQRFDHEDHRKTFEKQDLGCPACHQLGGRTTVEIDDATLDAAYLTPPAGACHFCHNPVGDRVPVGPNKCITCHLDVPPPDSHGAGWLSWHGADARVAPKPCESCHTKSWCSECHFRKEPMRHRVHDRAWLAIHGIASFADPTDCTTCHLQSDCTSCHATSNGRYP